MRLSLWNHKSNITQPELKRVQFIHTVSHLTFSSAMPVSGFFFFFLFERGVLGALGRLVYSSESTLWHLLGALFYSAKYVDLCCLDCRKECRVQAFSLRQIYTGVSNRSLKKNHSQYQYTSTWLGTVYMKFLLYAFKRETAFI